MGSFEIFMVIAIICIAVAQVGIVILFNIYTDSVENAIKNIKPCKCNEPVKIVEIGPKKINEYMSEYSVSLDYYKEYENQIDENAKKCLVKDLEEKILNEMEVIKDANFPVGRMVYRGRIRIVSK